MASEIVDQDELRSGTASITKGQGNRLTYTSTFNFLVVTDSRYVTREEVLLQTPGLPVVGLIYGAINAVCVRKSATRTTENALYWNVSCDFDTGREDQKQDPQNPGSADPTTWIPVFKIDGFETRDRVLTMDKSSTPKPLTNTAKQPLTPRPTESITLCSFSFTQFEDPSQDINVFLDRNDTVNSTTFAGRGARKLKLNVIGAELGFFGNFNAWNITYKMTYDKSTWDLKVLNIGSGYLDAAGKLQAYRDGINGPVIIGNLTTGGARLTPANADPEELTFKIYDELDFNTFIRK